MNLTALFERLCEGGELDLSDLGVTDGDLAYIAGMSSEADEMPLTEVNLCNNSITNAGLATLVSCLPGLEVLALAYTETDAEGLKLLAKCGKLRELTIGGAKVTDECLSVVAQLGTLQVLYLYEGSWTDGARETLMGLRPDLKINE